MIASWVRCPRCRAPLAGTAGRAACMGCGAEYPVVRDVPDLRVAPDPWIAPENDRRKGVRVVSEAAPGFEAALRHYWALTPDTSPEQGARHIDHVLGAEARTREWLATLDPPPRPGERWLDVGCGTADLACAAPEGVDVSGVDVAFRWLMVAQRRLAESGRTATLLCANAEALPAIEGAFDRVFLLGTIEHCPDLARVLGEARRVLRPGGTVHLRAVNRLSLLPEPHVNLWGIGFLPRRWADRYVRWRGGLGYAHHWPRSGRQIVRGLARAGFGSPWVGAARLLPSEAGRLPAGWRWCTQVYERCRLTPGLRRGLRTVAPLLEAGGVAP